MLRKAPIPAEPGPGARRTCVGCREVRGQDQLVRVVRTGEGSLAVGRTLPGRGAWLCRDRPDCLDLAVRKGGFARSLRAPVSATAIADLRAAMGADLGS